MDKTKEELNVAQYLAELASRLDAAPHGGRGRLVGEAAQLLGWTEQRVYAQLKRRVAWASGRKHRKDKGATVQSADAMQLVAGMQKQSVRKNGKVVMKLPTALSIAATNGTQINVSRGRFGRLLRDRKMDIGRQSLDRPVQPMRSLHPNWLHQVDPSLCLLYYMKGEQQLIRDDQLYKNKLPALAKLEAKVYRYVLHEHTSSVIIPWYVEARGESVDNMFQFLMHAWSRQPGRAFHGVPKYLLWDKGSANTSHPVRNLLAALDVHDITHAAGRARVKGGVEGANNIVETKFESRLKFEPVSSVDELNRSAFAWANAFAANLIPHEDTRLHRKGLPEPIARADLWATIRAEELRILPPPEKCQLFLEGRRVTRKVSRSLEISYAHPLGDGPRVYDLAGLDGIVAGDTVEVSPLVYGECEAMVYASRYDGAPIEYRVKPIVYDDTYGFRVDAPVFGQDFRTQPDSEIERQGKALDRLAFPGRTLEEIEKAKDKNEAPFGGTLTAHSHLLNVTVPPSLAARRGTELTIPDRANPEEPRMARTAALILAHRLGEALTDAERAAFDTHMQSMPDGITETELKAWLAARRAPAATTEPAATGLRVVK
jgi:hypothetical protein